MRCVLSGCIPLPLKVGPLNCSLNVCTIRWDWKLRKLVGGVGWKDFEEVCFAIVLRWGEIIATRNTSDHLKNFILVIEVVRTHRVRDFTPEKCT